MADILGWRILRRFLTDYCGTSAEKTEETGKILAPYLSGAEFALGGRLDLRHILLRMRFNPSLLRETPERDTETAFLLGTDGNCFEIRGDGTFLKTSADRLRSYGTEDFAAEAAQLASAQAKEGGWPGRGWDLLMKGLLGGSPEKVDQILRLPYPDGGPERPPSYAEHIARHIHSTEAYALLKAHPGVLDLPVESLEGFPPCRRGAEWKAGIPLKAALILMAKHRINRPDECPAMALHFSEEACGLPVDSKENTVLHYMVSMGWRNFTQKQLRVANRFGWTVAHQVALQCAPGTAPSSIGDRAALDLRTHAKGGVSVLEVAASRGAYLADRSLWDRPIRVEKTTRPLYDWMVLGFLLFGIQVARSRSPVPRKYREEFERTALGLMAQQQRRRQMQGLLHEFSAHGFPEGFSNSGGRPVTPEALDDFRKACDEAGIQEKLAAMDMGKAMETGEGAFAEGHWL